MAYDPELVRALEPDQLYPRSLWKATPTARPHPQPAAYRSKFSGNYEHRLITGGVEHNLPQEAPEAFAQAIVDVAGV